MTLVQIVFVYDINASKEFFERIFENIKRKTNVYHTKYNEIKLQQEFI